MPFGAHIENARKKPDSLVLFYGQAMTPIRTPHMQAEGGKKAEAGKSNGEVFIQKGKEVQALIDAKTGEVTIIDPLLLHTHMTNVIKFHEGWKPPVRGKKFILPTTSGVVHLQEHMPI